MKVCRMFSGFGYVACQFEIKRLHPCWPSAACSIAVTMVTLREGQVIFVEKPESFCSFPSSK